MKAFTNFQINRILLHICVILQNCGEGFFTGAKGAADPEEKNWERIVFLQEMLLAGQAENWVENSLEEQSISRSPGRHLKVSGRQGGL